MSEFLTSLDVRQVDWRNGRPVWKTLTPLRYRSDTLGATIVVPAEMVTDLASVPRMPLLWLATGGRGNRSSVVHDTGYQFGFWWVESADGWTRLDVERITADRVFHESLLADPIGGAGPVRAWEMWVGVRLGGRGIWADRARTRRLNPKWSAEWWQAP